MRTSSSNIGGINSDIQYSRISPHQIRTWYCSTACTLAQLTYHLPDPPAALCDASPTQQLSPGDPGLALHISHERLPSMNLSIPYTKISITNLHLYMLSPLYRSASVRCIPTHAKAAWHFGLDPCPICLAPSNLRKDVCDRPIAHAGVVSDQPRCARSEENGLRYSSWGLHIPTEIAPCNEAHLSTCSGAGCRFTHALRREIIFRGFAGFG